LKIIPVLNNIELMNKFDPHLKVSRDKLKKDPSKLGKAVYDILSKPQATQTVEETLEAMTPQYFDELMKAANRGAKLYQSPYYVVVQRKKETIAGQVMNVLKHAYIDRQTRPRSKFLRTEFPNADHDVYEVDKTKGTISLLYTLPTEQDSKSILKNEALYDPNLVRWIKAYDAGKLDSEDTGSYIQTNK
jgi:hypothetical protein